MEKATVELRDDFVQMPVSDEDYPHVTISMVIDEMNEAELTILHEAPKPRRVFRWYKTFTCPQTSIEDKMQLEEIEQAATKTKSHKKGESTAASEEAPEDSAAAEFGGKPKALFGVKETLYVCTAETVSAVLAAHKKAYACVVVDEGDPLDFIAENSARCLVVSANKETSINEALNLIKATFVKMLIWERSLEIMTLKDAPLSNMLEVSIPVLKNYIFASDYDANVIAYTPSMEPPDELHRHIIKNKFLDPQTLKDLRPRAPQGEFCTYESPDPSTYTKISYPIYVECTYTGSLSMSCNNRADTKGLRDQFKILCDRCMPFFRKMWVNQISTNSPSFFFFNRLLENDVIDDDYLEQQKENLGLTTMNRFKLVILDIDPNFDVSRLKRVKDAASKVNGGRTHVFPYHDKLLMLLYGNVNEDLLDHVRIMEDIRRSVFEPFGVQASISSIFYNISDLDLAYKQAVVAFQYRPAIMRARFANDDYNNEALVTFEAALMYYLIDDIDRDERFLKFAFTSSVTNTLYREDLESGTNHLSILWCYLYNERNATSVAESLHMHRNTVLYNIQKIEQRFGLSLNDKTVRDWILLCFRHLILNTDSKILDSSLTLE